ncbi:MAG: EAL domain-containing protein [Solobacterium sp.]|nr:EAL domain-containing protein [Solobacterium sp.]
MIESGKIKRRHTVLVVDDHEINRDALGAILEDDYDVIYAENGQEALDIIQSDPNRISMILLDLMMPVMNGFELMDILKKDSELRKIPIIVLTAEKSAELRALQMGAADFITKPFDMHEVIVARVGRIIELSEGRQLISAAEIDRISGLYNRSFFYEYVNNLFKYHPDERFDCVILNIEKFHSVNALHGREFGNRVLRKIGEEILAFLKETYGIASRNQADRFEMFCSPQKDYHALLVRVQDAVNSISGKENVHLRMGVAPWEENSDPVTMVDHATSACNMVRGDYQNPLKIFNEEMKQTELLHQRLLDDLYTAEKEDQFKVFFQPKYDIQSDPPCLAGAEALVRWYHPALGMISPGVFIPLFESNGLISVVDNYVWRKTGEQIKEWKKKFGFSIPVSVNLSRADIFEPDLAGSLSRIREVNGLESEDLELEITESAYSENANLMIDMMSNLRRRGFRLEMDDFGTGYSSLNMLSEMPIDVLKMDMKFVQSMEVSETNLRLVKVIQDIAKLLHLQIVAEGAETERQVALLREIGCDLVQGYYFSKPLPAEEFTALFENELKNGRVKHDNTRTV